MSKLRHHSLVAWQRADDLFIKLHVLTIRQFPAFERFELRSQASYGELPIPSRQTSLKDLHADTSASVCIFSTSRRARSRRLATACTWRGVSGISPIKR